MTSIWPVTTSWPAVVNAAHGGCGDLKAFGGGVAFDEVLSCDGHMAFVALMERDDPMACGHPMV